MRTRNAKIVTFVFIIVLLNSITVSAIAASIGNARMVIYPDVNGLTNTVIEKTILVRNINDVPVNISLQIDQSSDPILELKDYNFILQPGEERDAKFNVKVKKEGSYEGKINVLFSSLNNTETNGTLKEGGVVLSSNIIVVARKDQQGYQESQENSVYKNETYQTPFTENLISENPAMLLMIGSFILTIILLAVLILLLKKSKPKKRSGEINEKKKK